MNNKINLFWKFCLFLTFLLICSCSSKSTEFTNRHRLDELTSESEKLYGIEEKGKIKKLYGEVEAVNSNEKLIKVSDLQIKKKSQIFKTMFINFDTTVAKFKGFKNLNDLRKGDQINIIYESGLDPKAKGMKAIEIQKYNSSN